MRCPRCRRGALVPDQDTEALVFGPLHCPECHASFPVTEGVADLVVEPASSPLAQRGMEQRLIARSYERYVRPALQRALAAPPLDRDSEYLLYRSLLGQPEAPWTPPGRAAAFLQRRASLHPREEEELRDALSAVGLVGFARLRLPPLLVVKAEKPAAR